MKKSPLTGITTGDFDSLRVRSPAFTGQLVEVTSLITAAQYDDVPLTAAVLANTTSTAANSATIAAHATAIAGKQNVIEDGDLTIARTLGLQGALNAKLDEDELPQIKYQGG